MDGEEADLLRRCIAGEQAACAQLVQRHARMVGTIIWRVTRQESSVEDLAQETFLRVFRALPEFAGRSKLSTWICTVAHRVALDHQRSRRRHPEEPLTSSTEESEAEAFDRLSATSAAAAESAVATTQLLERVRDEIERLPEKYRLPLLYAGIEGLDYDAIAAMLNMPLGSVKTAIHRGRLMLKERLTGLVE